MSDSTSEELRPEDRASQVEALLARIDAHDAEAAQIDGVMKALDLTSRKVTAIRSHRKTIAALMGLGLEKEAAAAQPRTRKARPAGGDQ